MGERTNVNDYVVGGVNEMSKYAVRVGNGWILFPSTLDVTWKPFAAAEFDTEEEATEVAMRVVGGTVIDHPMVPKKCVVVVTPDHDGRWQYVSTIAPMSLNFNVYMAWVTQDESLAETIAVAARRRWMDAIVHTRDMS